MLDELIPSIERVRSQGAIVVLKWDGERSAKKCTVVITRQDTNYVYRQDSEDIIAALQSALSDYQTKHEN